MGIAVFFVSLFPCDYNIRDAAFVDLNDPPYRLFFFTGDTVPKQAVAMFEEESLRVLGGSNIIPEIVHVSRDRNHEAMRLYGFWDLQKPPAVILASPDGRSLSFPIPEGGTVDRDGFRRLLQETVSSSVREDILAHVIRSYAVLLLIEGPDQEENRLALDKLRQASREIRRVMRQLPKRIDDPPRIISIPRERNREERVLLWSLDINREEMDRAQIAILFGRGRLFFSPFESASVSAGDITDMLTIIGLSCDCGLDKQGLIGRGMPLRWDESLQAEVVQRLGFDAENPLVKREIAGILSTNNLDAGSGGILDGSLREPSQYRERAIAFGKKLGSSRIAPALSRRLGPQSSEGSRSGFNYLFPFLLAGLALAVILAGVFWIRYRASRERP